MAKCRRVTSTTFEAKAALASLGSNPERHRKVMAQRSSGAAGKHDPRPNKQRTRRTERAYAIAQG